MTTSGDRVSMAIVAIVNTITKHGLSVTFNGEIDVFSDREELARKRWSVCKARERWL